MNSFSSQRPCPLPFHLVCTICLSVGWSWAYPWTVQVPQRGGDAVAPVSGKTVPDSVSRKFQPSHLGRLCRISPEPLCWQLEGGMFPPCPHLFLSLWSGQPQWWKGHLIIEFVLRKGLRGCGEEPRNHSGLK